MGYYAVRPMFSWKYGHIYYQFDSDVLPSTRTTVREQMHVWQAATGVVFFFDAINPDEPDRDKGLRRTLQIKRNIGSDKGDIGLSGRTITSRELLVKDDIHEHSALHELGHVIGFLHEHERPDGVNFGITLGSFIEVTVRQRWEAQFGVYYDTPADFDYDSVMLYTPGSSYTVSSDQAARFEGKGNQPGKGLSLADVATVRKVYGGTHPPTHQTPRPSAVVSNNNNNNNNASSKPTTPSASKPASSSKPASRPRKGSL